MATKFRIYDGESIIFYATNTAHNAELLLNTSDQLEVINAAGGFKANDLTLTGSVLSGTWAGSTIAVNKGGTGLTSYTAGDLIYASAGTTLSKLAKGANGSFLTVNGSGNLTWANSIATGGLAVTGDVTITGNLTITGTQTVINTSTLNVSDNIITLNQDVTGTPSENAGIEIERGTSTNASILWDEATDKWKIGIAGSEIEAVDLSSTQALINKTYNALALTSAATGFTIAGGTASRTLTLNANLNASTSLNLTGTSNRISVSGSTTLSAGGSVGTIDIASTYVGQTSITTLGTIATGTWNATTISVAKGGTGLTTLTAGSLMYGAGTSAFNTLAIGTSNYVLQSTGSAPEWRSNLIIPGNVSSANVSVTGNIGLSTFASGFDGYGYRFSKVAYGGSATSSISAVSNNTTAKEITITTSAAHGILVSQAITITGAVGMTDLNTKSPFKVLRVPSTTTLVIGLNTSQTWTSGGTITPVAYTSLGEVDNLVVRGTMQVYELLIQQVRATNGSLFVTASATVNSITTATVGSEVIVFEDPAGRGLTPFAVGDILLCKRVSIAGSTIAKQIVRQVSAISGSSVTFTTTAGAPVDTSIVEKGDVFVRIGNVSDANRRGSIYLTSDDSNAPYININAGVAAYADWTNATAAGAKLKVRLGRLDGITDTAIGLSGSQSNLYGLYSDSAYLKGNLVVGGGQAITHVASTIALGNITGTAASSIKISNTGTANTSGIFGYNSGGTEVFKLALDSTAQIAGWSFDASKLSNTNVHINSSGYISMGATPPTAYGNNVGAWLGYSSGAKLSLYADANNYLQWDGGKLLVKAANFTLDSSGNLTASNATISGAITATSGSFTGTVTAGAGTIGGFTIGASTISSTNITLTSGTSASIKLGSATAFGTGTGVWIDNAAAGSFRVGNPSGNRISYASDGTVTLVAANAQITGSTGWLSSSNILSWNSTSVSLGGFTFTQNLMSQVSGEGVIQISNGAWATASNRRLQLGYLGYLNSTDVYGIQGFNTAGVVSFELSDTQLMIGGFYFDDTTLWAGNADKGSAILFLDSNTQQIRLGATGYNTSGIFIGKDTSYKMSLVGASGSLLWDGANLSITGSITATAGRIGGASGWLIDENKLTTTSATNYLAGGSTAPTAWNSNGTGFYIGGQGLFRVGTANGTTLTSGIAWSGSAILMKASNMEVTSAGNLWAQAGGFGRTSATPNVEISTDGLVLKDGATSRLIMRQNPTLWNDQSTLKSVSTFTNSGFETAFGSDWATVTGSSGTATRTTTTNEFQSGTAAVKIIPNSNSTVEFMSTTITPSVGGNVDYTISFDFKSLWDGEALNTAQSFYIKIVNTSYNAISATTNVLKTFVVPLGSAVDGTFAQWVNLVFGFTVGSAFKVVIGSKHDTSGNKSGSVITSFFDTFVATQYTPTVEISKNGFFAYTSDSNYIKAGVGGVEIKGGTANFKDVVVQGNLSVYGTTTTYVSATSLAGTTSPIFTIASNSAAGTVTTLQFLNSAQYIKLNSSTQFDVSHQINWPSGNSAQANTAYSHSQNVTGAVHGATNNNTANMIVRRDASGNFSAGTITAALTGNASTASAWANGRTISLTGNVTGTSGSWTGSANISFATTIASNVITNAMINSSAAIADTKLATISTAGKVSGTAITSGNISTSGSINTTNTAGFTQGGVKYVKIYRESIVVGAGGIAQGATVTVPNSRTYTTTSVDSDNKMFVYVDGRLQKPGASYDYVEASTTTITFNYDIAEGASIEFIIHAF